MSRRTQILPTVDLSIDFDFFVHEDVNWDWGHAEDSALDFSRQVWALRYQGATFNFMDATDPKTYADFMPNTLMTVLAERGGRFKRIHHAFGIADSHRYAYEFLLGAANHRPPDYLVNLDAHHDVYTGVDAPIHCGNWVSHLHAVWGPHTQFIQYYPKWKDVTLDRVNAEQGRLTHAVEKWLQIYRWGESFIDSPVRIRNVFICRSGAWVPPHLDPLFVETVLHIAHGLQTHPAVLDSIPERDFPTREAHERAIQHNTELFNTLMNFSQTQHNVKKE